MDLKGILQFLSYAKTTGFLEFFLCFSVFSVYYIFNRNNKEAAIRIEGVATSFKEFKIKSYEADEKLCTTITKLTESIDKINLALVRNHITKADLYKNEWKLVTQRLNETANITFLCAFKEVCYNCDGQCKYLAKFSEIIEKRRKESFHIWEREAIPISVLKIVEQVDEELYVKVLQQYIPDITAICNNDAYNKLDKEIIINLLKQKIEIVIEKVKCDWMGAILKRVNIGND